MEFQQVLGNAFADFMFRKEDKKHEGVVKTLRKIWVKVPYQFSGKTVQRIVNKETGKNYGDAIITRKMRYLRERGEINFKCVDISTSTYVKI